MPTTLIDDSYPVRCRKFKARLRNFCIWLLAFGSLTNCDAASDSVIEEQLRALHS